MTSKEEEDNDDDNRSLSLLDQDGEVKDVSSEYEVESEGWNMSRNHSPGGKYNQSFFDSLEQDNGDSRNSVTPSLLLSPSSPNKRRPMDSSYAFTAQELNGLGASLDAMDLNGNGSSSSKTTGNTATRQVLLPNNHMPFFGRQDELTMLQNAVERISLEWMENPSEVVWISGPIGVGKTTLFKQATDPSSNNNKHNNHHLSSSSSFTKAFICRGTCEQYSTATQPFRALTDCLNDMAGQLLSNDNNNHQKPIWKTRLEEALGGEGPLVCTICPSLCKVLDCSRMEQKYLMIFDANTNRRLDRLAFAVRDLLQAVSEYHPLVMVVDNIHWADSDSLTIMQELLTTKPLQNFLLIGLHDSNIPKDHRLMKMKALLDNDEGAIITRTTHIRLQVLAIEQVEELLCRIFLQDSDEATSTRVDEIQDLAELVFALTKGNPLWMIQLLRFWNDTKWITYNTTTFQWEWNRKKLKKDIKQHREDTSDTTYQTLEGIIQARLQNLPKKILFVVMVLGKLKLTSIQLDTSDQDPFVRVFTAAAYHKNKKTDKDPITTLDELEKMMLKACHWGILKKLQRPGAYKFANDLIRECASTLISPYGVAAKKQNKISHQQSGREALTMQLYMGTELSAMSSNANKAATTTSANTNSNTNNNTTSSPRPAAVAAMQRERFKFLAVEQLYTCVGAMDDTEKSKLAKINLEAAEIAISKTAFQTAIVYLERSVAAVDHTLRWQSGYYDVTMRSFLFLARMRWCCGRHAAAMAACDEIMENCNTVKDRVYANQVAMFVLQDQDKYDVALEKLLDVLRQMGEVFPTGGQVKDILEREVASIRKGLTGRTNQQLLNPKKLMDKKVMDIMMLLAHLVQISRQTSAPNQFAELATIRMMHLSLKGGFTRQYPLAFSMFGKMLVERGHVKEAHRLGQITERIARLSDFYGGEAVALFHWHISHWRRSYKRNLEPVLQIYNAQVDAGDFSHVSFSIHVYIQYHLASGFDLEKLNDNLHLFQGLYMDYDLGNEWQLQIHQQAVTNLLGGSATPLIFFGVTLAEQDAKLEEFRKAGLNDAIQYMYFLQLYIAFFFHDFEVMEECFEKLDDPPKGVWIPWMVFWECYMMIQDLPASKGKKRKDLKDKIESLKGQLIDWYNAGAPNPNAMTSILQAEYIIAKEAGKGLSAMKAQDVFNEAVEAAKKDGAIHLEAFACERAGQHFGLTGVEGYCTDYLKQSYRAYERCHFIAKVIDMENQYPDKLMIDKPRARPGASYIHTNMAMKPSDKLIGGGQGEVKTINVKKGFKKAAKVLKGGGVKKTSRKVKNLFKKEKAEPAPWGWNSKNRIALEDDDDVEEEGGMEVDYGAAGDGQNDDNVSPLSPSPRKGRSFFGLGKKKKKSDSTTGSGANGSAEASPTASPNTPVSPSAMKSPSAEKSPRRPISALFGRAKPPLTEMDAEHDDDNGNDNKRDGEGIDDMLESPKPRASRKLDAAELEQAWELPMDDDGEEVEKDAEAEHKKPKGKKVKKKGKKDRG